MTVEDLFHPIIELPERVRSARYRRLVGLDDVKDRLRREAYLLADPRRLHAWAIEHHGGELPALELFRDRPPLFVFAGDVGSGKSALAESFGCEMADTLNLTVYLYRLKLSARGSGLVGEMTTLIGNAFAHILAEGRKAARSAKGPSSALVVVVDEADALAQSRAAEQMHHEDRAGVDALLAGVDSLAGEDVPVIVVMCTNREPRSRPRSAPSRRRHLPLHPSGGRGAAGGARRRTRGHRHRRPNPRRAGGTDGTAGRGAELHLFRPDPAAGAVGDHGSLP